MDLQILFPETNSKLPQKGKDHLPTIDLKERADSFRECKYFGGQGKIPTTYLEVSSWEHVFIGLEKKFLNEVLGFRETFRQG